MARRVWTRATFGASKTAGPVRAAMREGGGELGQHGGVDGLARAGQHAGNAAHYRVTLPRKSSQAATTVFSENSSMKRWRARSRV